MSIRIASFNVKNLSFGGKGRDLNRIARIIKENDFDIVALQEVLSEGKILTGAKVSDLRGQAKAYDISLKSRLGAHWASTWRDPESKAISSPYLGNDDRGEGYAFLWNTNKVNLPKKQDGTIISPYIEHNYKLRENGMIRLIRDPCVGRFKINGRPVEIRLINTHIVYGKPKEGNLDIDLDHGAVTMRKNEFKLLAGQIYNRVNSNHRDTPYVAYTIILGDYNLNLRESEIQKAIVPSAMCFDQRGFEIPFQGVLSPGGDHFLIHTVQAEKSTLKKDEPGFANNFDHFSMDDHTLTQTGIPHTIDAVRQTSSATESDEQEMFDQYRNEVSDHIPIVIEIDC